MSNDENIELNNSIDAQQLKSKINKMATITSSVQTTTTIQNSITEHVLNNELNNLVQNNKLNNGHSNDDQLNNLNNLTNWKLNDDNQSNDKLNDNNDNFNNLSNQQNKGNQFNERFLITNQSTVNLLKDNLNLINSDYFNNKIDTNLIDLNNSIDSNNNSIDLNNNLIDTNNTSQKQQLKDIFSSIRNNFNTNYTNLKIITKPNQNNLTELTNQLTNRVTIKSNKTKTTSPKISNLLIEKNLLFNQFYNSTGMNELNGKTEENMNILKFNNNNTNQFDFNQMNHHQTNQISKLITDDYLTEHDQLNHFIQINSSTNNQFSSLKQISPIKNDHQNKIKKDSEDEIYEDVDNNLDNQQSISNDLNSKLINDKSNKTIDLDIETMKTHLAKLKLTNFNNSNNSIQDELNDDLDNDNDYFDAIDDDDDDDDEEINRVPMIRSTSLKTGGKTKNLGPESKKMVRFADAMGLDLAKIKNISQEDLPNVPASAFLDLKMCKREVKEEFFNNQLSCSPQRSSQLNYWNQSGRFNPFNNQQTPNKSPLILSNGIVSGSDSFANQTSNWPILVPEFVQPFTQFNFLERVRNQNVCLESCVVSSIGNNLSVDCLIRVQNIAFEKVIMVRHTSNNWVSWLDSLASYIPNSGDGKTDKFSVKFYIKSLNKSQRVKFAIKYLANQDEYWDNNLGQDYVLRYKT